jgi:hypothetical protein
MLHVPPAQQSAVVVHPPLGITHDAPQTNGAPASAIVLGTHARPQQSALDAHGCPCREPASAQS